MAGWSIGPVWLVITLAGCLIRPLLSHTCLRAHPPLRRTANAKNCCGHFCGFSHPPLSTANGKSGTQFFWQTAASIGERSVYTDRFCKIFDLLYYCITVVQEVFHRENVRHVLISCSPPFTQYFGVNTLQSGQALNYVNVFFKMMHLSHLKVSKIGENLSSRLKGFENVCKKIMYCM